MISVETQSKGPSLAAGRSLSPAEWAFHDRMLHIDDEKNAFLPPPILADIEEKIRELALGLSPPKEGNRFRTLFRKSAGSMPESRRFSLQEALLDDRRLLESRSANCMTVEICGIGIARYEDHHGDPFHLYFLQLDETTIASIYAGTFDGPVIGQGWPCSRIEVYWAECSGGSKPVLGILPQGAPLKPVFDFPATLCQWPADSARLFSGTLVDRSRNPAGL